jgi:hypothetical protein
MEAYKELFRHKRNEKKRREAISCFQAVWTQENIFGRLQGDKIKWNLTPHQSFLSKELGAWLVPPIRIIRRSPSPDLEAEFVAQPNLADHIDNFIQGIAANWGPPAQDDDTGVSHSASQSNQQDPDPKILNECSTKGTSPRATKAHFPSTEICLHHLNCNTERNGTTVRLAANSQNNEPLRKATSRNKRKCKRGKKTQPEHAKTDSPSSPALRGEFVNIALERLHPTSRSKRRCYFGPQTQRGRSRSQPEQHEEQARSPPTRPPHRRWDVTSHWLPEEAHVPPETEELSRFPARITLAPPTPTQRTPFDHYKAGPHPPPGTIRTDSSTGNLESQHKHSKSESIRKLRNSYRNWRRKGLHLQRARNRKQAPPNASFPKTSATGCCGTKSLPQGPCWACINGRWALTVLSGTSNRNGIGRASASWKCIFEFLPPYPDDCVDPHSVLDFSPEAVWLALFLTFFRLAGTGRSRSALTTPLRAVPLASRACAW